MSHTPNAKIMDRSPEGYRLRKALPAAERQRLYIAQRENDWAVVAEFTGEDIGTN